jgi:hypothetical protein
MANSSDVKLLTTELEQAIKDGVDLFKYYKELSNVFQDSKKNTFKENIDEKLRYIKNQRRGIMQRIDMPESVKAKKIINLANEEKLLKKSLKNNRGKYNEISLVYLANTINTNKKFLKEKEKIRKEKKRILSRIKIALSQLKKKMFAPEFNMLIKYIYDDRYNIADNKQITFKKLMNHLESGEITEEASKKTKQIDELKTINNIEYRKSEIEYEINKLKKNKEKKLQNKKSKLQNEKIILLDEISKIRLEIIKIYENKLVGVPLPPKFEDVIKVLKSQSLSDKDTKKYEKLKQKYKELVSKLKKLQ